MFWKNTKKQHDEGSKYLHILRVKITLFEQNKTESHPSHGFDICRKGPVLLWTPLLEKGRAGGGKRSYMKSYLPYSSQNEHFLCSRHINTWGVICEKNGQISHYPQLQKPQALTTAGKFVYPDRARKIYFAYMHTYRQRQNFVLYKL